METCSTYDALVVATGVTHAYFGHDDWAARAPGLKTLDDAVAIRRRVLVAFERAERETDPARQRELLTFVVIGGGPTGVEMAGAIAEIARQALRDEFDAIAPQTARVLLLEGGPTILPSYVEPLRAVGAAGAGRRWASRCASARIVTGIDAGMRCSVGDERIAGRHHRVGGRRAGVAARPHARRRRSIGWAASQVLPDLSVPGHPEMFVAGDLMALPGRDGQPMPGVAQAAMQAGRGAARQHRCGVLGGRPTAPFTLPRSRQHGDDRPRARDRRPRAGSAHRVSGVARLAVPAPGLPDRVQEPAWWCWCSGWSAYVTRQRGVRLITGRDAPGDAP